MTYDIVPGESITIDRTDILILEGLNVLSANGSGKDGRAIPFVCDFFDFSVYLHASEDDLEKWFVDRFMRLRDTAFRNPLSYYKKYADLDDATAEATERDIWTRINLRNLRENILPTMPARASF